MISRESAQRKQEDLLKAAAALFFERGYEDVSVDNILKRAGGSKTTVYSYFGCKDGLFLAAVRQTMSDLLAPVLSLDVSSCSPLDGLRTIGVKYLELVAHKDARALLLTITGEARRFPCLGAEFFNAGPGSVIEVVSRSIRHWQGQRLIRKADPRMLAEQYLGGLVGTTHTALLVGVNPGLSADAIQKRVQISTELFLQGAALPE